MSIRAFRGFTLLEMLVVLALMALAAGIAVPRASGWLASVQERGWRADLRAYLESVPVRAFLAGQEMRLDAEAINAAVPGAPAGMEVQLSEPLYYGPAGVAGGGRLQLKGRAGRESWAIEPISGRVIEGA